MPIPLLMDATWMDNASVSYNAQELRRADSVSFNGDGSAFGVRGGIVRHGDASLSVSVNSSDVVTIQPGAVVIPGNAGSGNGCYRSALGASTTGNLNARNATNPRITLLVYRAMDTDVVGTHGAYTGRIEFIDGAPAASPVAPALPTLAVELCRFTVPAVGGGTATVDTTNVQYAVAAGGILPVPSASKLPAADSKWDRAVALDTGVEYRWTGAAWVSQASTEDSGWILAGAVGGPVWNTGWGTTGGAPAEVTAIRKVGSMVTVMGQAGRSTGATNLIMTLPVGFRPSKNVFRIAAMSGGWAVHSVQSDGQVLFSVGVTGITNVTTSLWFGYTFWTDQP